MMIVPDVVVDVHHGVDGEKDESQEGEGIEASLGRTSCCRSS